MRALTPVSALLLFLPFVPLFSGCSDQDAGRISKVSGKALERAHRMTDDAGQKMGINLQRAEKQVESKLDSVKPTSDGNNLSERVQTRLKWDDILEGLTIRVRSDKGVVTLTGKIRNEMQRRRAMALAESTKGVEKVIDGLELDVGVEK
jgi:hyperosmotically inducible protein